MEESIEKLPFTDVAQKAGGSRGLEQEEIDRVIEIADEHWVGDVASWASLSCAHQRKVGLPVRLEQDLDDLVSRDSPFHMNALERFEMAAKSGEERDAESSCQLADREWEVTDKPTAYCFVGRDSNSASDGDFTFFIGDERVVFDSAKGSLDAALEKIGGDARLVEKNGCEVASFFPVDLLQVFCESRVLVRGTQRFTISHDACFRAVERWLASLHVVHLAPLFKDASIDEFLVLPFLRASDLERIGVTSPAERNVLMTAVRKLQEGDFGRCMEQCFKLLGLHHRFPSPRWQDFNQPFTHPSAHVGMHLPPDQEKSLVQFTLFYAELSSVEASDRWLRANGFEECALIFLRFNVPFYSLPLVNIFALIEMGVDQQLQELAVALPALRNATSFKVRAMAFWLQDLGLAPYSLTVARQLLVDFIDALTILTDAQINRVVDTPEAREALREGVQDMRSFQSFHQCVLPFTQGRMLEKYASMFAKHEIGVPAFSTLTPEKLREMGMVDEADIELTMECVARSAQVGLPSLACFPNFKKLSPATVKEPPPPAREGGLTNTSLLCRLPQIPSLASTSPHSPPPSAMALACQTSPHTITPAPPVLSTAAQLSPSTSPSLTGTHSSFGLSGRHPPDMFSRGDRPPSEYFGLAQSEFFGLAFNR